MFRFSKTFTTILIFGLLFLLNQSEARAAAGDPDPSFIATLSRVSNNTITSVDAIAVQPDGKIIVGGKFFVVGKYPRICVARLNADGTPDPTFAPLALEPNLNEFLYINKVEIQPDGKILIGGEFLLQGQEKGFLRLNTNGTLDTAFNNNLLATDLIYKTRDFVLSPDGKIFFAGAKKLPNGATRESLWRIGSGGNVELERASFFAAPMSLAPGGQLVVFSTFSQVVRLNADLSTDPSFQTAGGGGSSFLDLAVQPDGKVVIGGSFNTINGFQIAKVARYNADGSLDPTFGAVNPGRPNEDVRVVKILPNGKILIGWP